VRDLKISNEVDRSLISLHACNPYQLLRTSVKCGLDHETLSKHANCI